MNRNKMTTTAAATPGNSKKLRNELRRVMSDRVMKITRCSQQQNVEKVKQRMAVVDLLTSTIGTPMLNSTSVCSSSQMTAVPMVTSPIDDFARSQPATMASQVSPNMAMMTPKLATDLAHRLVSKDPSPLLAKLGTTAKLSPQLISAVVAAQNHVTKISLQPIKQFGKCPLSSLIGLVLTRVLTPVLS